MKFFLDGSFELWVKLRARGRKQQKRWTKYNYIFIDVIFYISTPEKATLRTQGILLRIDSKQWKSF